MNKNCHILLTGNSSHGVREIHFPKAIATIFFTFVTLFVIASGVMTYLFFTQELDRNEFHKVQSYNKKLEEEMSHLTSVIDTLKYTLESLKNTDKRVRKLEGLEPIDEDIRQMGVGGIQYIDSLFYNSNQDIFSLHNDLLQQIGELQRQVGFEKFSYNEVDKFVNVKNEIFKHTPSIKPAFGRISDGYGYRTNPFTKKREFHHGTDIAGHYGGLVHSAADGTVAEIGYHKIYGYYISINHGYGYTTFFGHLSKFHVKRSDKVTKNQIIGEIGNSGISTGSHLHYEVHFYGKSKNPVRYFNKNKSTIFVDSKYLS